MIPWYILAGVNLGWLFVFEACETENDLLYKNPLILCWHAECEQLFIVHSYSYHMNYFKGGCGIMFFIRTVFLPWSQALHIIKSAADWWHCLVSMAWKQCSGKKCLHVPVAVQCVCYTMLVFHVMMQEAGVWNLVFCGVKDIYQNDFFDWNSWEVQCIKRAVPLGHESIYTWIFKWYKGHTKCWSMDCLCINVNISEGLVWEVCM